MNTTDAKSPAAQLQMLVAAGEASGAEKILLPVMAQRVPFRLLDMIGESVGCCDAEQTNIFLETIAADRSMGGWVVIASALRCQLDRDFAGVFRRCCAFVIAADSWYGTDIFGERVPGPSLVAHFEPTLEQLFPWHVDENVWIRRMTGVAVHFWAKRARGKEENIPHVRVLLDFLQPMFTERDVNAVEGVGWGLKTLGRYYPEVLAEWLVPQIDQGGYRALMAQKAMKYLPPGVRRKFGLDHKAQ